ncbi:MAG: hypothetical protein D6828_05060 [Nitrospirae bacterium]|nr:MAG: hypothetical protein D6828_05060 [Nitrospirota bacterium]
MRGYKLFCIIFFFFISLFYSVNAYSEDIEESIKELQNRLMELEMKLNQMKQQQKEQALESRVLKMEKELSPFMKPNTFRVYWKDHLTFETPNKEFKLKIVGRIQNDWTWQSANQSFEDAFRKGFGDEKAFEDGTEFRRTWFGIDGAIYEKIIFHGEWDFTDGDTDFIDVYMGIKDVPYLGHIMIGHFWEPFSLEDMTPNIYITFMERSHVATAFAPDRNTGIKFYNTLLNDRIHWSFGVFRNTNSFGDSSNGKNSSTSDDGEYDITARITGLPWYEEDGRKLLHLGLAVSRRSPHEDQKRYSDRPPVHQTTTFVDTGTKDKNGLDVFYDKIYLLGTEAALVYGPLSIQSEWAIAMNDRTGKGKVNFTSDDDVDFTSWYIYASYFLTGEHREYNKSTGTFGGITPRDNFYDKKTGYGLGAWEAAIRYADIDLDDSGIKGGELDDITLGLNWYLNKNTRLMLNYVTADLDRKITYIDPDRAVQRRFKNGDYHAFMMRFQLFW